MNTRSLKRLAADHAALRTQSLPPNYLFPTPEMGSSSSSDDLTQLDILLAGPTHTPFSQGLFKLHISIPSDYPTRPPAAHFRTPIFHPNVDPQTGAVCVETLKRDWHAKLTLRDVLITISCLLIQPNPDSALNSDAAALIRDDFEAFASRATLMASIQACVPRGLESVVRAAQQASQEDKQSDVDRSTVADASGDHAEALQVDGVAVIADSNPPMARRRRTLARARHMAAERGRRRDGSPVNTVRTGNRQNLENRCIDSSMSNPRPFISSSRNDDIFSVAGPSGSFQSTDIVYEDENMSDADQENDASLSPSKTTVTNLSTPRRPHGAPMPLGELIMEEDESLDQTVLRTNGTSSLETRNDMNKEISAGYDSSSSFSEGEQMDAEYPPSPCKSPSKSPSKSPMKQRQQHRKGESDNLVSGVYRNITPLNAINAPLAAGSPFVGDAHVRDINPMIPAADMDMDASPSPRKVKQGRGLLFPPITRGTRRNLFATPSTLDQDGSVNGADEAEGTDEDLDDSMLHQNKQQRQRKATNTRENRADTGHSYETRSNNVASSSGSLSNIQNDDTFRVSKRSSPRKHLPPKAILSEVTSAVRAAPTTMFPFLPRSSQGPSGDSSDAMFADRMQLWEQCGKDIRRWNRGDFDNDAFRAAADRW